jgi:predicted CXXCH cytochrome family protein
MRKLRVGLSTALILLVLSIFSVSAFAADAATGPKITDWKSGNGTVEFTWEAYTDATNYIVKEDGVKVTEGVALLTYSKMGLTNNEEIVWDIIAVTADGKEHTTELILGAGGPTFNTYNSTDELRNSLVASDGANDNGIINANETGNGVGGQTDKFSEVIKSVNQVVVDKDGKVITTQTTHRTHGEYQNNTNSCASCHQTHTAASKNLLFKNGVYTTCTACHDGTLGFYNVFETGANASKSAGTFGGTHDGNMSVHLANGAVSVKAAPGGNRNGEDGWAAEFTCASCHAPHGSFSDRLLHPNPNHMGNLPKAEGGKKLNGIKVVTDITTKHAYTDEEETALGGNYVLYKNVLAADPAVGSDYALKGLVKDDVVYQVMKWNPEPKDASGNTLPAAYEKDTDPWLHGYDWDAGHTTKLYWSSIDGSITTKTYNADGTFKADVTKNYSILNTDSINKNDGTVIQGYGFMAVKKAAYTSSTFQMTIDTKGTTETTDDVKINKLDSITKASIARAYVVKLDMRTDAANTTKYKVPIFTTNVSALWKGTKWADGTDKAGSGVKMSTYCSSCHTDYLAHSGATSGTWNQAYRHSTDSDTYTCVRCHYAHGTDVTVMMDSKGKTVDQIALDANYFPELALDPTNPTTVPTAERTAQAKAYMMDKAPSSALKRFTNMAVCWGCHTSSHSEGIRNSSSFDNLSGKGGSYDQVGLPSGK